MLVVPIPPPAEETADEFATPPENDHPPFTRSTHSRIAPFNVFWGNEKWRNLTQNRQLLECVSIDEARRMGDWISGARCAKGREDEARRTMTTAAASVLAGGLEEYQFGSAAPNPDDVQQSFARTTLSPLSPSEEKFAPAPEGFWEPEIPPYVDKSFSEGSTEADTAATGIEPPGGEHPGPATVVVELSEPGKVKLEMTKTSMPIWQFVRGGAKIRLETHTFVVVTTLPRTPLVLNNPAQAERPTPTPTSTHFPMNLDSPLDTPMNEDLLGAPVFTSKPRTKLLDGPSAVSRSKNYLPAGATEDTRPAFSDLTPTEEIAALEMPSAAMQTDRPNRPIFFNRDGTVSGKNSSRSALGLKQTEVGLSMDVHELLKTTDWSKTSLGPRDQWPQSLKTIGGFCASLTSLLS